MTVAVGMSGGVDSSVASTLFQQDGHDVIGITIKLFASDSPHNSACFSKKRKADIDQARDICSKLNIAHHVIDLSKEFRATVLDYFQTSYSQGLTPNPCVMCNKHIKFDLFLEKAREIILDWKGANFDPRVVEAFIAEEEQFIKIAHEFSDQT